MADNYGFSEAAIPKSSYTLINPGMALKVMRILASGLLFGLRIWLSGALRSQAHVGGGELVPEIDGQGRAE